MVTDIELQNEFTKQHLLVNIPINQLKRFSIRNNTCRNGYSKINQLLILQTNGH